LRKNADLVEQSILYRVGALIKNIDYRAAGEERTLQAAFRTRHDLRSAESAALPGAILQHGRRPVFSQDLYHLILTGS
jgi:hypothetical protein